MTTLLVSIIIPVVNNLQLNKDCLESIWKHTRDISYEIVVVDNHSTDGSREYFKSLGDKIRLICNDTIKTYAQSNNQGAKEAVGEYLVFLNNDTYVTQGWLSAMLDCMRSNPKIGIVGNKHLFPSNDRISHVGGVFNLFDPEHIYLFYDANQSFLNQDREYQWVTAACIMISRQLYFDIGGFCEEYRNSFEDVDLCLKARESGKLIYYCHKSVIYHYGLRTKGRTDHEAFNKELFDKKWKDKIRFDKEDYFKIDNVPACLGPDRPLERYLEQQSASILALTRHIQDLNELAAALDRRLKASEENAALMKQQRDQFEASSQALDRHLQAVHNTLSWRITRPLRLAKKLFGGRE